MKPYADSNFFVRLYLSLKDSEMADGWLAAAQRRDAQPLPVTWLHRMEMVNAFEQQVFVSRFHGQPRITSGQSAAAQANFREDLTHSTFMHAIPLGQTELDRRFEEISLRHTARHGFRAYDVIHVASALLLECDVFWSFDAKACRLAALEGLKVGQR